MATYWAGYEGFVAMTTEAGMLDAEATSLPVNASPLALAGYTNSPGIDANEGSRVIPTGGLYQGIQINRGRREFSFRTRLTLGKGDLLRYGLRNSTVEGTRYKSLPVLLLAGGAGQTFGPGEIDASNIDIPVATFADLPDPGEIGPIYGTIDEGKAYQWSGSAYVEIVAAAQYFTWIGRYAQVQSVGIRFSEGQAVQADVEMWPLALTSGLAHGSGVLTTDEAALIAAGKDILLWQHADFTINGVSYRDLIRSVSVRWSNGLQRVGMREDSGDADVLSRCALGIVPLQEEVSVEYELFDQLPKALWTDADAVYWGGATLTASYGSTSLTVTIAENYLARTNLSESEPNAVLRFAANSVGRNISVAVS